MRSSGFINARITVLLVSLMLLPATFCHGLTITESDKYWVAESDWMTGYMSTGGELEFELEKFDPSLGTMSWMAITLLVWRSDVGSLSVFNHSDTKIYGYINVTGFGYEFDYLGSSHVFGSTESEGSLFSPGLNDNYAWAPKYMNDGGVSVSKSNWDQAIGDGTFTVTLTATQPTGWIASDPSLEVLEIGVATLHVTSYVAYGFTPFAPVPEPSTLALGGISALVGMGYAWRHRRRSPP